VNLALTVIEIVAPVFLIAGGGFMWVKLGFEYRIQFVTRLSMTLGVPCLIFTSLMQADISAEDLGVIALAAVAGYAAICAVFFAVIKVANLDLRSFLIPLTFGNTGNLGLPIAFFAYGDQGLSYALGVFAISGFLSFTFGVWIMSGGGSLRNVFREPLVAATILGAIFLWQDWQTPLFLTRTLELIGQMTIPLMLLTLGVAVARLDLNRFLQPIALAVLRIGICVATGAIIGNLFTLDPVAFGVLVLQLSTPVAVTTYMLSEKYGGDSEAVAGLVVISTFLSVASLPITLAFLV